MLRNSVNLLSDDDSLKQLLFVSLHTNRRNGRSQTKAARRRRSRLQDFVFCLKKCELAAIWEIATDTQSAVGNDSVGKSIIVISQAISILSEFLVFLSQFCWRVRSVFGGFTRNLNDFCWFLLLFVIYGRKYLSSSTWKFGFWNCEIIFGGDSCWLWLLRERELENLWKFRF